MTIGQDEGPHKSLRGKSAKSDGSAAYGPFKRRRQEMITAFGAWLRADNPDEEQIGQEVEAITSILSGLAELYREEANHG